MAVYRLLDGGMQTDTTKKEQCLYKKYYLKLKLSFGISSI